MNNMSILKDNLIKAVNDDNIELIKTLSKEILNDEKDDEVEYYYYYSMYEIYPKLFINFLDNKIISDKEKVITIFDHIIDYLKVPLLKDNVERFFVNQSLENDIDIEPYLLDYYEFALGYEVPEEKKKYDIIIISENTNEEYKGSNHLLIDLSNLPKYNKTYFASLVEFFKGSKLIIDISKESNISIIPKLARCINKVSDVKYIATKDEEIIEKQINKVDNNLIDVSFYDSGTLVNTILTKSNEHITFPKAEKKGFVLTGYYINNKEITNDYTFTKDTSVNIMYHSDTCKVSYYDGDTLLKTITVKYNEPIKELMLFSKKGHLLISHKINNIDISEDYIVKDDIKINCIYEKIRYDVTIMYLVDDTKVELEKRKILYNDKLGKIKAPIFFGHKLENMTVNNTIINEDYLITSDVTIYLNYSTNKYTVTIMNEDKVVEERKLEIDKPIGKLPEIKVDGYSFLGYYINDQKIDEKYIITGDTIVNAKFSINTYKVSFYDSNTLLEEREVKQNDTIGKLPKSNKSGYVVEGIYTDKGLKKPFSSYEKIKSDITLYVKLTKEIISENADFLIFGKYPQTVVSDSSIISKLDKMTTTNSSGYYEYDGKEYAKAKANPNIYQSVAWKFSDNKTTITNSSYYFLVEPIKWKILDSTNVDYLLLSDRILDQYNFHYTRNVASVSVNDYEHSSIRTWLNKDFYDKAFSTSEQARIKTMTIDDQTNELKDTNLVSNSLKDKVSLPSYQGMLKSSYGYTSKIDPCSARSSKLSDYSIAKGCWVNTLQKEHTNGYWWLRTPHPKYNNKVYVVYNDGSINDEFVDAKIRGVCPIIRVKK